GDHLALRAGELERKMPFQEPLGHECQLARERDTIVRCKLGRRRRAAQLDFRECLQRIAVERPRVGAGSELRQKMRAAEVLEQHETPGRIGLVHMRHVNAERLEQRGDAQIRPHVLRLRRRVHDDQCRVIAHHAEVAAEAGIARGGLDPSRAQTQISRQPTLQQRESRIVIGHRRVLKAFQPAKIGRAIIMPPFMPRLSPFWTALLSIGGLTPLARACDPPTPPTPPAPVATAQTARAKAAGKTLAGAGSLAQAGSVDIEAGHATLDRNGMLTLSGHVVVRQGQRRIESSQLQYDKNNNSMRTRGGIEYADPLVHVTGAGGSYSPTAGARFDSAKFSLVQRSARGAAKEMELSPQGLMRLEEVTFTTCPVNDQAWILRAAKIVLDTRNKVGTGRDARIDFKGVPLLYLPWVSFPLGNVRKSGFLFPTVANTSNGRAEVSAPYYFDIAPNIDFTFVPTEYSRRGPDVAGDFRYLTQRQRGELDWDYLPNDAVYHAERSRIRLRNVTELPGNFRLTLDGENVSDT